jgi:hypothetical protein
VFNEARAPHGVDGTFVAHADSLAAHSYGGLMERTQFASPALELFNITVRNTARLVEIQLDTWRKLAAAQSRAASVAAWPGMTPWFPWINGWWTVPTRDLPVNATARNAVSEAQSIQELSAAAERESVRAARQAALEDIEPIGGQQGLSPRAADERGKRRRS